METRLGLARWASSVPEGGGHDSTALEGAGPLSAAAGRSVLRSASLITAEAGRELASCTA